MEDQQVKDYIARLILKTQEVLAIMKDGKTIVAYEKLGGVLKNLSFVYSELHKPGVSAQEPVVNADK